MGHYEVLGVDPSASMDDIRKAYLRLARQVHPDVNNASAGQRARAEDRMREINAAWAVLGDVDERSAYDRQRLTADRPASRPFHASSRGHEGWTPFEAGPVRGFDDRDDRPITSSTLPRWLAVAPPVLVVGGLVALIVGALVGVQVLIEVSIVGLVLSGVLFLAAPMVALAASRREDRRA